MATKTAKTAKTIKSIKKRAGARAAKKVAATKRASAKKPARTR